jgi:hypothetical protein
MKYLATSLMNARVALLLLSVLILVISILMRLKESQPVQRSVEDYSLFS